MSRHQKLMQRILNQPAPQNIRFSELCGLLVRLGFVMRQQRGSHHIFSHDHIPEILNLQSRRDGTAKPYQIAQVRKIILQHQFTDPSLSESDDA